MNIDNFNLNEKLQTVLTNRNDTPIKILSDHAIIEYKGILENTNYKNYRPKPGETNSSRFNYFKDNLQKHII